MKIIEDPGAFAQQHRHCVVTIGKFDGVHIGHQLILQQLKEKAMKLQVPSMAIVIEPHPEEFFAKNPQDCPARLSESAEKLQLIAEQGVDYAFKLKFDEALCQLTAQAYVETILVKGLGISALIIGSDFRFGYQRQGDFTLLQELGSKFAFEVIETASCEHDGVRVSSTYVRQQLADARFDLVEKLLGRPYGISGLVVKGQQFGRTLGFPTCNVQLNRCNIPLHGVFACDVIIRTSDQQGAQQQLCLHGAANIGYRPTVSDEKMAVLEVHLLDFSGDLYGAGITVIFREKIRDELKFDSLVELKAQIAIDVLKTSKFFETFSEPKSQCND
jgi:riboflavin kinase/FMN adenylyltransferase